MRNECVYDDLCFLGWFELGGFHAKEIEEQMQIFAEEVMPILARDCGGKVELPARGLDLVV
jgi:hypothetical protein